MEGREHRNTGTFEGKMAETSGSITVSTKLERIAKLAREMPQTALTTLAHNIDIDWLHEAYRRTRKNGATGVDRQTAEEYAGNYRGLNWPIGEDHETKNLSLFLGSFAFLGRFRFGVLAGEFFDRYA